MKCSELEEGGRNLAKNCDIEQTLAGTVQTPHCGSENRAISVMDGGLEGYEVV